MRVAILTAMIACLTCVSVDACPCPKIPTKTAIRDAGAIFTAKVVSYKQGFSGEYNYGQNFPFIHPSQNWEINTAFSVSKVWKGTIPQEIILQSRTNRCSGQFTPGEEYLVYAYWMENNLITLPCTRTSLLSNAGEDLRALGAGQPPLKVQKLTDRLFVIGRLVIIMMLVAGAIRFGSRMVRRKKSASF
ncbi:MAG: hypothetical protein JMDDDDMK_01596 [Acidobacteria bacterium]|nr:hypothetical protein [Acidobacteriota bacterium]